MLLSINKLYKIFIYLAHAVLIVNRIKNNEFAQLYKIIFYKEVSIVSINLIYINSSL